MTLDMQLTDEEIKEIADRMDDLMWEGFHDIVDDVYRERIQRLPGLPGRVHANSRSRH